MARLSPLSVAAGGLASGHGYQEGFYASARVVDVALGTRLSSAFAAAGGIALGETFPFLGETLVQFPLVPSVDAYVLWASSLRERPRRSVVVGHVGGMPFGSVRFLNLTAGVCRTLWAVCPEVEVSWRRVWSTAPEGYPGEQHRREDQFGLLLRVSLGGWYEF